MKNQYLGDSGDFGKYGLLRFLARRGISVAVNWYLTSNDRSSHGKKRDYLGRSEYRNFDPELYDALKALCADETQTVHDFALLKLIPGAVYYETMIPESVSDWNQEARLDAREKWHKEALRICADADLVFCDPDNGLRNSVLAGRRGEVKYVFPRELLSYYAAGKDVVYYCHRNHSAPLDWSRGLRVMKAYRPDASLFIITFHKDVQRSYVFMVHPERKHMYASLLQQFLATEWGKLFTLDQLIDDSDSFSVQPAAVSDFALVRHITQATISAVYPRYYPAGAVAFFLAHHSDAAIRADIEAGRVWLLREGGEPVGTVTVRGSEICRLFVLPEAQGRGYGRALLDFAEAKIAEEYDEIVLDASLPARAIYKKRGYRESEYHVIPAEDGHFLCYDVMRKKLKV